LKPIAWVPRGRRGALMAIGTAGSLLLLTAGSAVAATHPPSPARVVVPQGIGPAVLKSAHAVGPAAPTTRETVSFVLRARNLSGLKARVNAGMPGGHLSAGAFAKTYGQTSTNISALTSYLKSFGISSGVHADNLDVTTTGTVAEYNAALGVSQQVFTAPAVPATASTAGRPAARFHGTAQPTTLPTALGSFVLSVLGLTSYPAGFSQAVHVPAFARGAQPGATQKGNLTPASFAGRYGLNPLLRAGARGQGQTIGIVTLASMKASDAAHFWTSILKIRTKPGRITLRNIDGGSGPVSDASGSGETVLDVEQSGALAPQASIIVYQAPNTDAGFLDAFATAASQNQASVVSSSWGESEDLIRTSVAGGMESSTYAQAFDEIFLEFAAQGQSSFIAAGDAGAYDASADVGSTDRSIDNPGDSPWTTDAGGTTLPGTITVQAKPALSNVIRGERAWGWDWLWRDWKKLGSPSERAFALQNLAGGGGGYSGFEPTPGYQARWLHVHLFAGVQYLTPTTPKSFHGIILPSQWTFTPHPTVTLGTGSGRAVPDISADADPFTGYEEYFTGFQGSALETSWGGTSFVAPQLAGSIAVIDSYLHRRVGFLNPFIYHFAAGRNSPFTPLMSSGTSNDNMFYTGRKGLRYNPGSGLGTPNFARLAAAFR
jgi:kumamolisin